MAGISGQDQKTPDPKTTKQTAIDTTIQIIGDKLDKVGIAGPLRNIFIQNAEHVLNAATNPAIKLINGMAYPTAIKAYGEGFRTFSEAIDLEYSIAKLEIQQYVDSAAKAGIDEKTLKNVVVAFNALKIAAATFGVDGIFKMPDPVNPILEGQNIAKANQLAPNMKLSLRVDGDSAYLAVTNENKIVLKMPFSSLEQDLKTAFQDIDKMKKSAEIDLDTIMLFAKVGLDQAKILCISAAANLADSPGLLNARGLVLKYDEAHKPLSVDDKFAIGQALSKFYATVEATMTEHKLEKIPPIGIAMGG